MLQAFPFSGNSGLVVFENGELNYLPAEGFPSHCSNIGGSFDCEPDLVFLSLVLALPIAFAVITDESSKLSLLNFLYSASAFGPGMYEISQSGKSSRLSIAEKLAEVI